HAIEAAVHLPKAPDRDAADQPHEDESRDVARETPTGTEARRHAPNLPAGGAFDARIDLAARRTLGRRRLAQMGRRPLPWRLGQRRRLARRRWRGKDTRALVTDARDAGRAAQMTLPGVRSLERRWLGESLGRRPRRLARRCRLPA